MNRKHKVVAALAGATLLLAACGGDDDDAGSSATSAPAATAASTTSADSDDSTATTDASSEPTTDASSGTTAETAPSATGDPDAIVRLASNYLPAGNVIDPHKMTRPNDMGFVAPLYDRLITRDNDGNLAPQLATDWTLSPDGLTLNLTLRDDVTFQDGAAVDAEAVKANLERAKGEGMAWAAALATVTAVDVVSPTEVKLTLSEPGAAITGVLAGYPGMMISPAAFDDPALSATTAVGAGPFTLASIDQTGIKYRKWDQYWDADAIEVAGVDLTPITDDTARFNAMQSGQFDITWLQSDQSDALEAAGGFETVTRTAMAPYAIIWDASKAGLDNADVRLALNLAIDREGINQALFNGTCTPAVQPWPEGFWAHDDELDEEQYGGYDPDRAKELLETAGYGDGLTINLITDSTTQLQQIAQAVQAQYEQVGVTLNLEVLDATQITPQFSAGQGDGINVLILSDFEPTVTIDRYYLPGGNRNRGNAVIPGLAETQAQLKATVDQDERTELMATAIQQIMDFGMIDVPVCHRTDFLVGTDEVSGLEINAQLAPFPDWRNLSLSQ